MKLYPLLFVLLLALPSICLGKNSGQGFEFSFGLSGGSFTPDQGSPSKSTGIGMGEFGFAYTFQSGFHLGGNFQSIALSIVDKDHRYSEWDGDGLSLFVGQKWNRFKIAGGLVSTSLVHRERLIEENYENTPYGNAHGSFLYAGYTLFRENTFDIDIYVKSLHLSLSQYDLERKTGKSQQVGLAVRMYPQTWNFHSSRRPYRTHIHYHHYHGSGDLIFGLLRVLAYSGKHLASLIIR